MNVNFDGMRKNATSRMNDVAYEFQQLVEMAKDGKYFDLKDFDELVESFNNAAGSVDIFNCLYDDNIENDMNDLSEDISINLVKLEEKEN